MPLVIAFIAFWFFLIRWAIRSRLLTWQRFIAIHILPGLVLISATITPLLYVMPQTIWPPLAPEMTWPEAVAWLGEEMPSGKYRYTELGFALWRERPPAFWLTQIPLFLLSFPVLAWAWRSGWGGGGDPKAARTATHGSSRWRRQRELKTTLAAVPTSKPSKGGLVAGSSARTAWLTKPEVGNPHALIVGATRSGKSRRVIMPTVWALGHAGESMILTDPKGEIHSHTAGWLKEKGYEVVLLDLLHPARGNRWNQLAAIEKAYAAGDTEEASRLAWEIGHILAWGQGTGNDPIWPQAEESLIAALCLAAAIEAPTGTRHMPTAYRLLTQLGHRGGDSLDKWIESLEHSNPARLAYGTAALSESRTRSSIYTGTAAHLRLWGDPGIAWMCAASDHDPAAAGTRPMAIFLLMPDEAGARRNIASLYINQAYGALAGVARAHGGKLPTPVWFLLDEFGNIGKLPGMAEKLTVAAGRNIRFVLAVQATAQISHIYGDKAAEILSGNCDTWLFLRAADNETARAISDKAGTYTVRTQSLQRKYGGWHPSSSEGSTSRALLNPDEILRWQIGESLLLQAGQFPARLPISDLSAWREASKAFQPAEAPAPVRAGEIETWTPERPEKGGGTKKTTSDSVLGKI